MPLTIASVDSALDIARAMIGVVDAYYLDVLPYQSMSIMDFYRLVRKIPYCVEYGYGDYQNLQRPGYTLNGHGPFTACANKSITIASYLKLKGIPYRLKIVSDDPNEPLHHVFPEALFGLNWVPMDATYPENSFGIEQHWYKTETIEP